MSRVKFFILAAIVFTLLGGCDLWHKYMGREDLQLGEYVTIEAPGAAQVNWVFTAFPDSSHLTANDILPADTARTISFKPDVVGKFNIRVTTTEVNGKTGEQNYYYTVEMPKDGEIVAGEIPEHLKAYLENKDTLSSGNVTPGDTQNTNGMRAYMSKVITPKAYNAMGQATVNTTKTTVAVKPVKSRTRRAAHSSGARSPASTSRGNMVPRANKSFTLQVSSWGSLEEAQTAVKHLRDKYGLEGYIQRVFFKDTDQVFYRVRVGNYKTHTSALAAAKELKRTTRLPVWVDFVRQEM